MERFGTVCGIIGAFLAAAGMGLYGYPLFFLSSIALCYSAVKQGNKNLMALQAAFLLANIIGLKTFVF